MSRAIRLYAEGYDKGLDDGTEMVLAKLITAAEARGPLSAQDLRQVLARLVEIHRGRAE